MCAANYASGRLFEVTVTTHPEGRYIYTMDMQRSLRPVFSSETGIVGFRRPALTVHFTSALPYRLPDRRQWRGVVELHARPAIESEIAPERIEIGRDRLWSHLACRRVITSTPTALSATLRMRSIGQSTRHCRGREHAAHGVLQAETVGSRLANFDIGQQEEHRAAQYLGPRCRYCRDLRRRLRRPFGISASSCQISWRSDRRPAPARPVRCYDRQASETSVRSAISEAQMVTRDHTQSRLRCPPGIAASIQTDGSPVTHVCPMHSRHDRYYQEFNCLTGNRRNRSRPPWADVRQVQNSVPGQSYRGSKRYMNYAAEHRLSFGKFVEGIVRIRSPAIPMRIRRRCARPSSANVTTRLRRSGEILRFHFAALRV